MIVVIFRDGGEKYLSERFWDEDALTAGVHEAARADGADS